MTKKDTLSAENLSDDALEVVRGGAWSLCDWSGGAQGDDGSFRNGAQANGSQADGGSSDLGKSKLLRK